MKRHKVPKRAELKFTESRFGVKTDMVLLILVVLTSVIAFFQIAYYYNHPSEILNFKFWWFCIIVGIIIIVWGVLQVLICKWLNGCWSDYINKKSVICMIATGIVFVFFIYSMLTLSGRLGVISINSADEIKYVRNYQYGNYKLNCDIDASEIEDIHIGTFSGKLDGQGKTIRNLATTERPFIKKNRGTITNLVIEQPTLTFPLVNKNKGNINTLTVNGPEVVFNDLNRFGTICGENTKKGSVASCVVNGMRINSKAENVDLLTAVELPECDVFGGICAENEGEIANCNIAGMVSQAISVSNFGGISGVNGNEKLKATITNCSVTDMNVNMKCSESFGGISGSGYANYLACKTSGNVNLYGTDILEFGGICGALNDSGTIKYSNNAINLSIIVLNTTYETNIAIGGVSGVVRSNTQIDTSQNNGHITATINSLGRDTDFYVGGMLGLFDGTNCDISNSVNYGNVKLNGSEFKKDIWNSIYVGGFACSYNYEADFDDPILNINNCCTFGSVESAYGDVTCMGGFQAYGSSMNAFITNSFFAGKISKPNSIGWSDCQIAGIGENNYYTSGCGYTPSYSQEGKVAVEIHSRQLTDPNFIIGTLGWDENVWNIQSGAFPTLKPYVIEASTASGSEDLQVQEVVEEKEEDVGERMVKEMLWIFVIGSAFVLGICLIIGLNGGTSNNRVPDAIEADDYDDCYSDDSWLDAD